MRVTSDTMQQTSNKRHDASFNAHDAINDARLAKVQLTCDMFSNANPFPSTATCRRHGRLPRTNKQLPLQDDLNVHAASAWGAGRSELTMEAMRPFMNGGNVQLLLKPLRVKIVSISLAYAAMAAGPV